MKESGEKAGPSPWDKKPALKPKAHHPRHILNEIKWRGFDLERCEIEVLHRGAPQDTIRVRASEITLGRSFFGLAGSQIPYHRITKIKLEGKTVFQRQEKERDGESG